jgi:channel protein (hemolysin III family)
MSDRRRSAKKLPTASVTVSAWLARWSRFRYWSSRLRSVVITGIVSVSVFATTMVLLYLASTLFHALPPGRAKRVFQVLDHSAIFLLIAGTYTPFTLGVLRGAWGWALFGVVGIVLKALGGVRYTTISTWAYLAMGWVVVIAAERVWTLMPAWGLFWLIAGGLAYTLARCSLRWSGSATFTLPGICS